MLVPMLVLVLLDDDPAARSLARRVSKRQVRVCPVVVFTLFCDDDDDDAK